MRNMRLIWCLFLAVACAAVIAPAELFADEFVDQMPAPPGQATLIVPEPGLVLLQTEALFEEPQPAPSPSDELPPEPRPIAEPISIHMEPTTTIAEESCSACGGDSHQCGHCNRGSRWARFKACMQWSHWGYADRFCPTPLGYSLNAHLDTQITNGLAAQMVLYRYDFHDGILDQAHKLNPHGRRRLASLVAQLACDTQPLTIQTTAKPELDEARRQHVLQVLNESVYDVPEEWVVVDHPEDPGLSGEEATVIQKGLLQQTTSGGATMINVGGSSSYGSSSFGSSGGGSESR